MAIFRQQMVDYMLASEVYNWHSHMIVVDLDLDAAFSPFVILHSFGKIPDSPVANSGRQG